MKNLLLLPTVFLMGCDTQSHNPKHKFSLSINNGDTGWTYGTSIVECDSFKMITTKIADVWVDGTKNHIECERVIYVSTNK